MGLSHIELVYDDLEKEFMEALEDLGREDLYSERAVLATSYQDNVTARRMRLLSDGFTLYGWTSRNLRKTEQIIANPNVSVVVEYIQIDGVASVRGNPVDEPDFLKVVSRKLPHRYDSLVKNWRANRDRVVIEVKPKRIALWKIDNPNSGVIGGLYLLDVEMRKAYRLDPNSFSSKDSISPVYTE